MAESTIAMSSWTPRLQDSSLPAPPPEGSPPTASQEKEPPKVSAERPLSSVSSCLDESTLLKRRVTALEYEKEDLTARAADAEERAAQAEARAAAAEVEMHKAKGRAQARYTEKVHARNESRDLRLEVEKQKSERREYMTKVKDCFDGLKTRVEQLEAEKAYGTWSSENKAQQLQAAQDQLQTCQSENFQLKQNLVELQSDLAAELSKPTAEDIEARINALKAAATANLQRQAVHMQEKYLAEQKKTIKEMQSHRDTKFLFFKASWQSKEKQTQKLYESELQKTSKLEEQLAAAHKQIEWHQQLQMSTMQNQPRHFSTDQQDLAHMTPPNTHKHRRLDSSDGYEI
ncbi:hypothetical protein BDW02DRAFT_382094 [Decorospora gaudefroyi]|uniref:Uncharacterized protein n=1 Tax=Decorospora gaudefroyi TaxID=184978 RepID=A0A6A5K7X2_9PLEO|nr:hypothetical protein BDW02DRAFT_382094 [Decorospora gaudefroyi]